MSAAMGGVDLRGVSGASSTVSGQLRAPAPVGIGAGRVVARLAELEYDNPMCDLIPQEYVTQPFAERNMG